MMTKMATSPLTFSTKAETLCEVAKHLTCAEVLPQQRILVDQYRADPNACLAAIFANEWSEDPLIVRSSAQAEDGATVSLAGHFTSVLNVEGREATASAIDKVIESYGDAAEGQHLFVQPMVRGVALSGVAFTHDPNSHGPYLVINYDDTNGVTDTVTGGTGESLKTYFHHRNAEAVPPAQLAGVIAMARELETLFGGTALDIEFAVDVVDTVFLLQVRPLTSVSNRPIEEVVDTSDSLTSIADFVRQANGPHPYLLGDRVVYGIMPDWNPAEIIGVRPRQLAASLYRELITDATWAYQRDNYGYRNLRSFPLMVSFGGLPYIDTRVSFNSFIPKDIDDELGHRLVNYYTERLIERPELHDKIEFEVVFSCYTLDIEDRLSVLLENGFSKTDVEMLQSSLRRLTNLIIDGESGYWRQDMEKIRALKERRHRILSSNLDRISRIYWLIEDCRRYGTLPFAGLARAGFIAVELLRSLVKVGAISDDEYGCFMGSLDTISSRLTRDVAELNREVFLAEYGHLRPGTYDILSPRYDEAPDQYFDWSAPTVRERDSATRFRLSLEQLDEIEDLLVRHGLVHDVTGLFKFIRAGIEGREYAKFVFSRSLSDVLSLFGALGEEHGFSLEDCSHADIRIVRELMTNSHPPADLFERSIAEGKRQHDTAQSITLPPLITAAEDVWAFSYPPQHPNYITRKTTTGRVVRAGDPQCAEDLSGAILMIENADPGFDWIFSHEIAGFITKFGGANSHMAIRAAELGIPAVIGTGEILYLDWSRAEHLKIDCSNHQVQVLR